MAYREMLCHVCGSNEFDELGGKLKCKYCKTEYVKEEEESEELRRARALFYSAEKELEVLHFENAEDEFENITKQYPKWSAGYWGIVRAKFGINYVTDTDGKRIPICHASKYEDFSDDPAFKKAVAYAEGEDLKAKYEEEAKKISDTCAEWRETAKKYTYDVFISFKATEDTPEKNRTADYSDMQELYTYLTGKGLKVFFSPVSMREFAGKKYDAYIHNALEKAKVLVLYGGKEEYFTAKWVQTEWTRYSRMIRKGLKREGSLLVAYGKGVNPYNLPRELRELQAMDASARTFYPDLLERINALVNQHAPAVDRVEINAGKRGKKVAKINETVQMMEAGTKTVAKKATGTGSTFVARELGSVTDTLDVDEDESLSMGADLLQEGSFSQAKIFFDDCLKKNEQKGRAWLGSFCVETADDKLYHTVVEGKNTLRANANILKHSDTYAKAIEFAPSREIAERLLEIIRLTVESRLSEKAYSSQIVCELYKIASVYKSDQVAEMKQSVLEKFSKGVQSDQYTVELIDLILSQISDADEYVAVVEKLLPAMLKNGEKELAKKYNASLLEVDETNYRGILTAFYLSLNVCTKEELQDVPVKDVFAEEKIGFIRDKLLVVSRASAKKILDVFWKIELEYLADNYFKEAEAYFDFVSKYQTTGMDKNLEKHEGKFDAMVREKHVSFFEKCLALMADKGVDWHIEKRVGAADALRWSQEFESARKMYESVSELEENNYKAQKGILYCALSYDGNIYNRPDYDKFDIAEFEKLLSFCPNSDAQREVISGFTRLFIQSMNVTGAKTDEKCFASFDACIRYYSEKDEEKMYADVRDMAESCLKFGKFKEAEKYFKLYLNQDTDHNHAARFGLLLIKLKCKNMESLLNSPEFNINLQEYQALLLSCRGNLTALKKFTALEKMHQERQEQLRKAAEEKRIAAEKAALAAKRQEAARQAKLKAEAAERERKRLEAEAARARAIQLQKQQNFRDAMRVVKITIITLIMLGIVGCLMSLCYALKPSLKWLKFTEYMEIPWWKLGWKKVASYKWGLLGVVFLILLIFRIVGWKNDEAPTGFILLTAVAMTLCLVVHTMMVALLCFVAGCLYIIAPHRYDYKDEKKAKTIATISTIILSAIAIIALLKPQLMFPSLAKAWDTAIKGNQKKIDDLTVVIGTAVVIYIAWMILLNVWQSKTEWIEKESGYCLMPFIGFTGFLITVWALDLTLGDSDVVKTGAYKADGFMKSVFASLLVSVPGIIYGLIVRWVADYALDELL